ncbi:hypothetical protein ALI22I_34030 [Saccharothrix sp. ALI-22-I]|nr:hypothetical protein ALI22I_34030 [Saccharothrix sp. ALI-22-I]
MTVTIKYGKGYEETWAVFNGLPDEVRADLIRYFGLDEYAASGLTLNELVINATKVAHGGPIPMPTQAAQAAPDEAQVMQLLKDELGARPIQEPAPKGDPWADAGSSAGSPPWDISEKPAVNPMLAQIEACKSVPELQRLWAENQAAFQDGALMDAYKAKGRALKAAA